MYEKNINFISYLISTSLMAAGGDGGGTEVETPNYLYMMTLLSWLKELEN